MLCAPAEREAVVNVAKPLLRATGGPRFAPPSRNCTVPVGIPAPEATVAENVTGCPKTEGLWLEVTAVVVLAWLTVCVGNEPILALKLPSPP